MPRVECGTVRALAVVAEKPGGLELYMDVNRTDGTRDDVISQCVAAMVAGTSATGQAVVTILPDLHPAASAAMCSNEGRPNPQSDRDTQFFPSQSQTEILAWDVCIAINFVCD